MFSIPKIYHNCINANTHTPVAKMRRKIYEKVEVLRSDGGMTSDDDVKMRLSRS